MPTGGDGSPWARVKRAVSEALELPPGTRQGHLRAVLPSPDLLSEAVQLLYACEQAEGGSVLDGPVEAFAGPVVADVEEGDRAFPPSLAAALEGRYAVEREIGRGGMATVFLARDERHGRPVAIKLMRRGTLSYGGPGATGGAALFRREIELAARLSHPHILPLYDSGAADGHLYSIMPWVDGETLKERLRRSGRLQLPEALRVLSSVARALAYAHRQGVVHCDLKPANILLSREGDALVADFGIARALEATGRGAEADDLPAFGTPAYMAPEQRGSPSEVGPRADLYALGILAWEACAGSPVPAEGASGATFLPSPLVALIRQMTARNPADRPPDAAAVVERLEAIERALGDGSGAVGERSVALGGEGSQWGTSNREARELYLRGRYLTNLRGGDALERALDSFRAAALHDPSYARAHAGVADTLTFLGVFGRRPPREAFREAWEAVRRALALQPSLVEARAVRGHLLFVGEWSWEAAEEALAEAIDLDPSYPRLRMYLASLLHSLGRSEEALDQLAVARDIDPLAPTGFLSGRIHVDARRPRVAIELLERELALDPGLEVAHQLLGHAHLQLGHADAAVESMRRAAATSGPRDEAQLAYVLASVGQRAEARRVFDVARRSPSADALGFHLAMASAALDDVDGAFDWLEAAFVERGSFMNLLAVATGFEALRPDPRFSRMLGRMGLPTGEGRSGSRPTS